MKVPLKDDLTHNFPKGSPSKVMTDLQWQTLLRLIEGEILDPLPAGLIIDSPWLPGWAGISMLDYFNHEGLWLDANLRAVQRFPKIMLLPGFWGEYGMCTEPSAFGAKCIFLENTFPHVGKTLFDFVQIRHVQKPNCRTDGLLPFVMHRLLRCRPAIEALGHRFRFATARGPLNIASYLLGHTEFLMGVKTNPEEIHALLRAITDFLIEWISIQAETFDSIDGIFLLDDLIGFLGDDDFREFALPYLKAVFDSRPVSVKFLHNDAAGKITARYLVEMGVNLFNFSFNHLLSDMRQWVGESVVLMGNIPPRDVLAQGTPQDVRRSVTNMLAGMTDKRRILISCGGGAPPDAPEGNFDALISNP
jgi:uroporphyrinogen-III decarboxylase